MKMPLQVFEQITMPLNSEDADGVARTPEGRLIPTKTTPTLKYYKYSIRKGSVSDRLFHMNTLDPPPKPPKRKAAVLEVAEEADVYEVEEIRDKRLKANGNGYEYLVKWKDWSEQTNTWEPPRNINRADVAAFEGRQLKPEQPQRPSLPARGVGCARVRLSSAEEARGGTPEVLSMVAGNVLLELKEPKDKDKAPTVQATLFVLSMDKKGHIIWPTDFKDKTKAALRLQARALLRRMIDDPLNPVDASWEPALTGTGTSELWQGAPQKQLVEVAMEA